MSPGELNYVNCGKSCRRGERAKVAVNKFEILGHSHFVRTEPHFARCAVVTSKPKHTYVGTTLRLYILQQWRTNNQRRQRSSRRTNSNLLSSDAKTLQKSSSDINFRPRRRKEPRKEPKTKVSKMGQIQVAIPSRVPWTNSTTTNTFKMVSKYQKPLPYGKATRLH